MADPKNKYAGLPGIAPPDEKDVFETDDLPEVDQDYLIEEESENIDRPHLNAVSAFEKFRGKGIAPNKRSDLSESRTGRPNIGYSAVHGEWELIAEGLPETLQQRRHRLEAEFRLLIQDLNKLKAAGDGDKSEAELAVTLVPELESSLRQLTQIQLPDAEITSTPNEHLQNIKKLISALNEKEKKKDKKSSSGQEGVVNYQLNAYPAHTQFDKSSRLADLELRLKQMETVLGTTPENLSALQLSDLKNVQEGITSLSAKVNVLDLNSIEAVDQKLGSLVSKMDAVVEKRGGPQQAEIETKVNELYVSLKKVEALSQSLLPMADRLIALNSLHQEAAEFKRTLTQLKAEVGVITNKIAFDETTAQTLQEGMKNLLETVASNIANFNARLAVFQK